MDMDWECFFSGPAIRRIIFQILEVAFVWLIIFKTPLIGWMMNHVKDISSRELLIVKDTLMIVYIFFGHSVFLKKGDEK